MPFFWASEDKKKRETNSHAVARWWAGPAGMTMTRHSYIILIFSGYYTNENAASAIAAAVTAAAAAVTTAAGIIVALSLGRPLRPMLT